ncbi:MAG: alkaline phosphatase family protein, partial [Myxococcota bacterium]
AIHGSPWPYDRYVPISFAGHDISPRTVTRRVATTDVAPTIAAYLGIKPPSGSIGDVLGEVLHRD